MDPRYKDDPYFPEDWLMYQNPKLIPLEEDIENFHEEIKKVFPDGIPSNFEFSKNITIPNELSEFSNLALLEQIVYLVEEFGYRDNNDNNDQNNFSATKGITKKVENNDLGTENLEDTERILTFLNLLNFKTLFITNSETLPTVLEFFETERYKEIENKIINLFSGSEEGQKLKEIYNSIEYKLGKVHEDEISKIQQLSIEKCETFYMDLLKILLNDEDEDEEEEYEVSNDGTPLFKVKENGNIMA